VAHAAGGPERTLDYAYDALRRVAQLTDSDGGVTRQSYDAAGNLIGIVRPNGVTSTLAYDARNRVQSIVHRAAGGAVLLAETYTRNAAGDIAAIDREDGSRVVVAYDNLRRVTEETAYAAGGALVSRSVHQYDAAGNRTRAGDASDPSTYVYDAGGRLLSGAGIDYEYDAAGRRVAARWRDGGGDRVVRYRWTSQDRLAGFEDQSGGQWSYAYDASGLRMRKSGPGGDASFLVDREHPSGFAQLLRATGAAHAQTFDWMDGLATVREDGAPQMPLADALGSVRALTGPSGQVTDTFAYDAWGRAIKRTGGAAALHRFAGEVFDSESQHVYLRARYYDPRTGTFLSRDPLLPPLDSTQAANPYLYAVANPVNRRDPSGLETIAELSVSQTIQSTLDKTRLAANTRKALARTWDTATDLWRLSGGYMGIQAVAESLSTGGRRAARWFGVGGIARVALDAFAAGLGEGANAAVSTLATAGMAKIAFDMLGARNVEIHVQGYGVLLAGSLDEAQTQIRTDSRADTACARGGLAYAARPSNAIAICRGALAMPQMPDVSTLTVPGRASLPGILLHEYAHLSLNVPDYRYGCKPEGVRRLITALGAPNERGLVNPDNYRCWAEDTQVGALALP
jgi:RHS repeat-associated protein